MLDKSIEYKNIIMRIDADKPVENPKLPYNYKFRHFENSTDINHWSRIETSVLEFSSEPEAKEYFNRSYYPYLDDLNKRCTFILNRHDLPIATATAWYADSKLGYQSSLQWVAVCPEYQGLGLGKAIVQKALTIFRELEPKNSVWLHTQTWSHVAVRLYKKLGFNIVKRENLANNNTRDGINKTCKTDFESAIEVLRNVIREDELDILIGSAV